MPLLMKNPKDRRIANGFIITAVLLLLPLGLYVGAYFGTVRVNRSIIQLPSGRFYVVTPTYGRFDAWAARGWFPQPLSTTVPSGSAIE